MLLYDPASAPPPRLHSSIQEFFNTLLRTVVRLRIVQALSAFKSILAVASVDDILSDESKALEAARTALQVRLDYSILSIFTLRQVAFDASTSVRVARITTMTEVILANTTVPGPSKRYAISYRSLVDANIRPQRSTLHGDIPSSASNIPRAR
jgi:hypothetical protein